MLLLQPEEQGLSCADGRDQQSVESIIISVPMKAHEVPRDVSRRGLMNLQVCLVAKGGVLAHTSV